MHHVSTPTMNSKNLRLQAAQASLVAQNSQVGTTTPTVQQVKIIIKHQVQVDLAVTQITDVAVTERPELL